MEDIAGMPRAPEGLERGRELLERARKRSVAVVALDWVAIVILVFVRARGGGIMTLGPTEDSIFALGLLAIAIHSGFRLGQLEKLRAVDRALRELDARSGRAGDPAQPG